MNEQTNGKSPEPAIVIISESTLVGHSDVARAAEACALQIRRDVEPAYGLLPVDVVVAPSRKEAPAGSQLVVVFDDEAQVNALGYYDEDPDHNDPKIVGIRVRRPDGVSIARVFARPSVGEDGKVNVFDGPQSLSCSLSHEVVEARLDRCLNRWVMGPDGKVYAFELCDPVDDQVYPVPTGGGDVSVSNFVLPAWFDPLAEQGPFDQMQLLGLQPADDKPIDKPFAYSKGGYLVALYPPADPTVDAGAELRPDPDTDDFTGWRPEDRRSALSRNGWRVSGPHGVIWSTWPPPVPPPPRPHRPGGVIWGTPVPTPGGVIWKI
jgi:hypothetical protein